MSEQLNEAKLSWPLNSFYTRIKKNFAQIASVLICNCHLHLNLCKVAGDDKTYPFLCQLASNDIKFIDKLIAALL